jgi:hypothetical protein
MSTTQQMLDAPPHAILVWCNSSLTYPRNLARYLKRPDLIIVPRHWLCSIDVHSTKGPVVLDHSIAQLTSEERQALDYLRSRA